MGERGMIDGQKIVFDHEGDQASGIESGDVVVVLHEQKHDTFERNLLDLSTAVKIGLTEALTGFQKPILTLDGRTLLVNTVKGEVIRPGEFKIVRGEGMPKYGEPSGKGNLIIRFDVEFPTLLDPLIVDALVAILPPRDGPVLPEVFEEVDMYEFNTEQERLREEEEEKAREQEEREGQDVDCATQ